MANDGEQLVGGFADQFAAGRIDDLVESTGGMEAKVTAIKRQACIKIRLVEEALCAESEFDFVSVSVGLFRAACWVDRDLLCKLFAGKVHGTGDIVDGGSLFGGALRV